VVPLTRPPALPRGTVPGPSAQSPGSIAGLLPLVTPAPAVPRSGLAQHGPPGAGGGTATALTADTGVTATGPGRLITLAVTVAAGLAALGVWFTMTGPARRAVLSLGRRRGRHLR
jgi:hypothetical protein